MFSLPSLLLVYAKDINCAFTVTFSVNPLWLGAGRLWLVFGGGPNVPAKPLKADAPKHAGRRHRNVISGGRLVNNRINAGLP